MEETLGARIKKLRIKKEISGKYMQEKLGFAIYKSYWMIEKDMVKVDHEQLIKIAETLNVDMNTLLKGIKNATKKPN
ncbi:MAG: helix-turn-helix domain-containing protein [Patescibacteria group bacterium]|jgi:transcriptional regulator with XRE-family HTH domain